jgi:hypothetical protein
MRLEELLAHTESKRIEDYLPTLHKLQQEASDSLKIKAESDYPVSKPIAELSLTMVRVAVQNSKEYFYTNDDRLKFEAFIAELGTLQASAEDEATASRLVAAINNNYVVVEYLIKQTRTKAVGFFIKGIRDALAEKEDVAK